VDSNVGLDVVAKKIYVPETLRITALIPMYVLFPVTNFIG